MKKLPQLSAQDQTTITVNYGINMTGTVYIAVFNSNAGPDPSF